jgi:disulfide bond formation protein DsbB
MKNYFSIFFNFFISNPFYVIVLFAIFSGISLLIAYTAEYIFKIIPCKLCMYSRIPFLILLILPLIFAIPKLRSFSSKGFFIIFLLVLIDIGLSFYHLGVENSWFKPSLCKIEMNEKEKYSNSVYDFLLGNESKLSSCENPEFKLFGIFSFAALNFIFSIFLFILINFFIFHKVFMKFIENI